MTYNSAVNLLHYLLILEMRNLGTERLGDSPQVTQPEREGTQGVNLNNLLQGSLRRTVSREMGTGVAQKERMPPRPENVPISLSKWDRKVASKDAHVLLPRRGEYTTSCGKCGFTFKDPKMGRMSGLPGRVPCITRTLTRGKREGGGQRAEVMIKCRQGEEWGRERDAVSLALKADGERRQPRTAGDPSKLKKQREPIFPAPPRGAQPCRRLDCRTPDDPNGKMIAPVLSEAIKFGLCYSSHGKPAPQVSRGPHDEQKGPVLTASMQLQLWLDGTAGHAAAFTPTFSFKSLRGTGLARNTNGEKCHRSMAPPRGPTRDKTRKWGRDTGEQERKEEPKRERERTVGSPRWPVCPNRPCPPGESSKSEEAPWSPPERTG